MNQVADVLGAIVVVALVTTLVSHPQTAGVVTSFGGAFSNSLLAAQGIRPR
jgi:preprotein translocase subunit SecG